MQRPELRDDAAAGGSPGNREASRCEADRPGRGKHSSFLVSSNGGKRFKKDLKPEVEGGIGMVT